MPVTGYGDLLALSARLRQMGPAGQGLRRELLQALNEAAKPLAREIADVAHLKPYMPDRYAGILATDLTVAVKQSFAQEPKVTLRATAVREKRRKVRWLDDGFINHPIYARGERKMWRWSNAQTGGMKAGFFSDPCDRAAPQVREKVLQAMTETARKITNP
jgi:hypothetical protein